MVLASRLSEDLDRRVLLVEAGNDTRRDPLVRTVRLDNEERQIRIKSTEQLGGARPLHSLGIGLGGSTSINGAKVDGPPASQIDAIREFGNPSWSWDETLRYMKKSQNYREPGEVARMHGATYDPSGHGVNGPLDITFSPQSYTGFPQETFIKALNDSLGIDKIVDAGAGEAIGFSFCPHFIKDGTNITRETSATAYLSPIEFERSNLYILTNSRGIHVNWEEEDRLFLSSSSFASGLKSWPTPWQRPFFGVGAKKTGDSTSIRSDARRATGITVQQRPGGPTFEMALKNTTGSQLTLSAGALITPLVLELSGVGDPSILSKIGVKTVIDLPGVGRNLADKPTNIVAASSRGLHRAGGVTGDPLPAVAMLNARTVYGENMTETEQYLRRNMYRWAREIVKSGGAVNEKGIIRQFEVMLHGIFKQNWPVAEWEYFSRSKIAIKTFVLQPWSRGYIHSKTKDSVWNVDGDDLELNAQVYSRHADMDVQIASLRAARSVLRSDAMRQLWIQQSMPDEAAFAALPPTKDAIPNDYNAWRSYILSTYDLICHNFGTAAMMARDLGGVVDENFKVYGSSNLHVVDASIFPLQLSAHPSLTIFGVAEKAADVLRAAIAAAAHKGK